MRRKKQTWLWQIVGEDLPGYSYLFGTIHIRDERAFRFLENAMEYLKSCEVLATEFNLDDVGLGASKGNLEAPENFSLWQALGKRRYARLEKLFRNQMGIPFAPFNSAHPFVITSMLTESIMSRDMPLSLDQTIWATAKNMGKELTGIETLEFQMSLIQNFDLNKQVRMLKDLLRNFSKFRKKQQALVELYAEADIIKVNKMARSQAGGFRKELLYNRNYTMSDRIAKMVLAKTHFFAVGGGHLPGQKGLIRLLKRKGFLVRPIQLEEKNILSSVENY